MAVLPASEFYRRRALGYRLLEGHDVRDPRTTCRCAALHTEKRASRDPAQHTPPYGAIPTGPSRNRTAICTAPREPVASPLFWLDNDEDWETWMRCWEHVYRGAGVGEGDVVYLAFSFGPYISHWTRARRRSSGRGQSPAGRWRQLGASPRCDLGAFGDRRALDSDLCPSPWRGSQRTGLSTLASSSVRTTIHAGEPGASIPGC